MDTQLAQSNFNIQAIRDCGDLQEILRMVKKIDALKVALEATDRFHAEAVKYARLEAEVLIRVVELGGIASLRSPHRKTAEWLYELSQKERERVVNRCAEGITIDQVYKIEVGNNLKLTDTVNKIKAEREWLLEEVKEKGIINVSQFRENVRSSLGYNNRELAADIIEGTKNRLLKAGAVGVGDGTGIYVLPTAENKEEVKKAIKLRYESVMNDFDSIRQIAHSSKIKMGFEEFGENIYEAERTGHGYIPHVLVALDRIGIISNGKEMYRKIGESGIYAEIKETMNLLQLGSLEAAKIILARYEAKEQEST